MNDMIDLIFPFIAGILTGLFFFLGLWFTTKKILSGNQTVLWTLGSFIVRFGITLVVFYFAGDGDYKKFLACLLGFMAAKLIALQITKSFDKKESLNVKETIHGTQS